MKTMKIKVADKEKLQKALDDAQSRARVRTVDYRDVMKAVEKAEERLSQILLKKDWIDMEVICDPNSQKFPNAYKGRPDSTHFILKRFSSGWFVTEIDRYDCNETQTHYYFRGIEKKAEQLVEFAKKSL